MEMIKSTNAIINRLHRIIYRTINNKYFNALSILVIVASIGAIVAMTMQITRDQRIMLTTVIYASALLFMIEYLLRIIAAPSKYPRLRAYRARFKYIFSFYGLVDFVAMLPCVLIHEFLGTDAIHLIVLPYIFITFKLLRHSNSFLFICAVLREVKGELFSAYTVCGILICFSSILMYYIEHAAQPEVFASIADSMWWAIITFSTVGYGDIYPITPLGRVLSGVISLIGIGMIALPAGIISSTFIALSRRRKRGEWSNDIEKNL